MTNKQKQCLLYYLGHYSGAIDGIWGAKSRQAEAAFRRERGLLDEDILEDALRKTGGAASPISAGRNSPANAAGTATAGPPKWTVPW